MSLARGYLRQPALSAERFVPHPFSRQMGARLYHTGDRVRMLSDGRLEFVGRGDVQVQVRGYRVEPGEIEQTVLSHPAVRASVVVTHATPAGDLQVVAYVVLVQPGEGREDWRDALRAFLRERLPEYMVPAHFLALDALPVTSNGKVDRQALPPRQMDLEQGNGSALPGRHGPLEELLAGIWQGLLQVSEVTANDHFFQLGGHSLLAMQLVARVRQQVGIDLPLRTVFEAPTLAALTERVQQQLRADSAPLLPPLHAASRRALAPLSFAQERLWFLEQLAPGQATYHVPLSVRLQGPLRPAALQASLRQLEERHEVLRLRIAEPTACAMREPSVAETPRHVPH